MPRYALQLDEVPAGVQVVTRDGGLVLTATPGESLEVGRSRDAQVSLRGEAPLLERVWGARGSLWLHLGADGRWVFEQPEGEPALNLNGAPVGRRGRLDAGDRLEPVPGLVLRVVDLDVHHSRFEPKALLEQVAEDPADETRWHVLADWLIEQQAPHALLAAYELKLEQGTRDPELIGQYVEARRARHQLFTDLRVDHLAWKCGYLVSCSLWLGPRDHDEPARLARAFTAPQFGALSRLDLQCSGTESRARLEAVLGVVPSTVRVLGLQFNAPATLTSLRALRVRPASAKTLRLHLADPVGQLARLISELAQAGWTTFDFEATRLADRVDELAAVVRLHPELTFRLGGTSIGGHQVASLRLPNVQWVAPGHDAMLVDNATGAAFPLTQGRQGFAWGLPLAPLGSGWTLPERDQLLSTGDTITGSVGRRYVYLAGQPLNDVYLAWLDAWAAAQR